MQLRALFPIVSLLLTAAGLLGLLGYSQTTSRNHNNESSSPSLLLRRRLATTDVPTDPNFKFDGSTSDLAQQFYRRHVVGDVADALSYAALPARIQTRLAGYKLSFATLPPLLQRAVIWDSGYAIDPQQNLIKVYTVGGVSMAHIAVSIEDYLSAHDNKTDTNCTTKQCADPNGATTYRSEVCSGSMMLSVAHCASEEVVIGQPHMSMWATGGNPNAVPTMNIERHSWFDNVYLEDYLVFAVHTTPDTNEPSWSKCPDTGVYSSVIIPCELYTESKAKAKNWQEPQFSALVDAWLKQTSETQFPFNALFLIPISGGTLLFFGTCFWFVRGYQRRKHPRRQGAPKDLNASNTTLDRALLSPTPAGKVPAARDPATTTAAATAKDPYMVATDSLIAYRGAARKFSNHNLLTTLLNDPNLRSRRLNYDKIVFEKDLAKGAFGEVWLCRYETAVVAVKRLLQTRPRSSEDVHAFIDEIQISATLDHPNILRIIGVAWNTLENLCMVMEYLPNGDLQAYLRRHGSTMMWSSHKLSLATGVARALQYLHCRSPAPLIHRDIKARNVLLTEHLETKLIDFGVSRSYGDCCMTVGVGTPYWTAPEVLEGTVYSEKSDIYSFGVLLSELDTCTAPYHDAKTAGHNEPLQPFHILKLVMAGTLQPNFTDACPAPIRTIATLCLQRDPAHRPSALDVVAMLEALGDDRDSF
ncbi:Tkl protein kinase, partial [Globisporangium splendens]